MRHRKRRAVVHIGHEKTGTTTLQYALDADREALREAGFLLPRALGRLNHTSLVTACLNDGVIDNIKAHQLARAGLTEAELRARLERRLAKEIGNADNWHTLVITSELIASRLHDTAEVDRLITLLQGYVDEIEIVIYLRRQDRLALSRFSSVLRAGVALFDDVFIDIAAHSFIQGRTTSTAGDFSQYFDFDTILGRYEGRAGVQLTVQCYQDAAPWRPVARFYKILGFAGNPQVADTTRLNTAMSAQAQYLIASLNRTYSPAMASGLRNQIYRDLLRDIEATIEGEKRTVSRDAAQSFYSRFSASNARVRQRYFVDATDLFDDDFSAYPEAVSYEAMKESMTETLARFDQLARVSMAPESSPSMLQRVIRTVTSRDGT